MFTGGCIGSTSGGIKMIRILVLIKNMRLEFKRLLHPMAVIPVRINGKTIPPEIIHNFLAFFFLYIAMFVAGATAMTFFGMDFMGAIGASIATIGNIGPTIGSVGPSECPAAHGSKEPVSHMGSQLRQHPKRNHGWWDCLARSPE